MTSEVPETSNLNLELSLVPLVPPFPLIAPVSPVPLAMTYRLC